MKKRLLALFLILTLTVSVSAFTVAAADGRVEVEFCVGDDTLTINGEAVQVEKPYVVGEGVTLVPLRVITEAFGAQVDWIGETKTITLSYPDVDIILQIDNPVAEVNGKAETLLAAPELTQNGFTMVPLRFISENFGAEVSYDDATKRISVIKEVSENAGSLVEGVITSKNIGDSYFGWTMENPTDMQMDMRYFDGTYTSFMYDENNYLEIFINTLDEEFDFDAEFTELKESLQGLTLVKAEKITADSAKKEMILQARDKSEFLSMRQIVTETYQFVLLGCFANEQTTIKEEGIRILSTFDLAFSTEDTYDLSNVQNGVRRFESESLKLSFDVPQNYLMLSDEDAENEFVFVSNLPNDLSSEINMSVYSKDNAGGAEVMANNDYKRNKEAANEEIVKFSRTVEKHSYKTIDAYEYTIETTANSYHEFTRDVFFEIGEYVYNMCVTVKLPHENHLAFIDSIINSISAEEIDASVLGSIMRNDIEREGTFVADSLTRCSITFPKAYEEISALKNSAMYFNVENGVGISLTAVTDEFFSFSDVKDLLRGIQSSEQKLPNVTIIKSTQNETIGKYQYGVLEYKTVDEDGNVAYIKYYATVNDGIAYIFFAMYPELSYSSAARQEVADIVASVAFE